MLLNFSLENSSLKKISSECAGARAARPLGLRSNLNNVEHKLNLDFRFNVFQRAHALAGEPTALRRKALKIFQRYF
jgi:hypothetical protein